MTTFFQTMVRYCEGSRCRHAVFSAHFGDDPPKCGKRCDACKEPKKSEKKAGEFSNAIIRGGEYRSTPMVVTNGYDDSLYEGGRKGSNRGFSNHGQYLRIT